MKKKCLLILLAVICATIGIFLYKTIFESDPLEEKTNLISEETDYYTLDISYPEKKTVGLDLVKDYINNRVEEFKKMAKEEVVDLRKQGFEYKYTIDIKTEVQETENYISYVLYIAEYTGGANVNQIVKTFVLNKENREEVSIPDILNEGEVESFVNKVKEELKSREASSDVFPGISDEISLSGLENFYVTEKEIVVLFSKYEVAPGAAGIITVSVLR